MIQSRRIGIALSILAFLPAFAGACGGDSSDDAGSAAATAPRSSAPLPSFGAGSIPKRKFKTVPDANARFIDLFVTDAAGADVDVYWGDDAVTGKLATTLKFGEVSDRMAVEVDENPAFPRKDGKQEMSVVFYLSGKKDRESRLMSKRAPVESGSNLTLALGWTDPLPASPNRASLSLGDDHRASAAPEGKAWFALNSIGIGGIPGGDFMTLSTATGCSDLKTSTSIGNTANSAGAYIAEPGATTITGTDANTECPTRTEPVTLDLNPGDRYVIFAYGVDKPSRKLLAVKVGD